jgi:hypothetical protein
MPLIPSAIERVLNDLPIILCELLWTRLHGEFVDRAVEPERDLIIGIIHAGPRVHADIEGLIETIVKGIVCGIVCLATSVPSTLSTPVPPLPKPGPS